MNSIDQRYKVLLQKILDEGVRKQTRNGEVLSIFSHQIRHNMVEGFPLLTTKKMAWKSIVTELLWFLRGDTNIKYLVDNDCHIWDGDAYKNYDNIQSTHHAINEARNMVNMMGSKPLKSTKPLSQEEFINEIKTDNEFAKKWGELGPIYGKQWRQWGRRNVTNYDLKDVKGFDQSKVLEAIKNGEDVTKYGVRIEYQNNSIDQIANLISELKTNPDSRRLMVNAWNVGELDQMVLPPCHYGFQVYTRELSFDERLRLANYDKEKFNSIDEWITWYKNEPSSYYMGIDYSKDTELTDLGVPTRAISLMWNQRSVDTFLGLPFNIASYALLLEIIAKEVNMVPEELIGNLGDVHLYANHIEQAKEQLERQPFELPEVSIKPTLFEFGKPDPSKLDLDYYSIDNLELIGYKSHPAIKAPLSN